MRGDWRITAAAMATTIAVSVFVVTFARALWYAPDESLPASAVMSERPTSWTHEDIATATTSSPPTRLRIPSLEINAAVQQVGVKENGEMATPSGFKDVGWYRSGPLPGQRGSAVITGHLDNGLGLSGVFHNLHTLRIGDDVYIETQDGQTLRFVAMDIQTYAYDGVPLEFLFNRKDKARLNLITCGGYWIKEKKTYSQRLVVYLEFQK